MEIALVNVVVVEASLLNSKPLVFKLILPVALDHVPELAYVPPTVQPVNVFVLPPLVGKVWDNAEMHSFVSNIPSLSSSTSSISATPSKSESKQALIVGSVALEYKYVPLYKPLSVAVSIELAKPLLP